MLGQQIESLDHTPAMRLEGFAAWLAHHMPNLQTLSLFVSACPILPFLSQLRHVEIQAGHLLALRSAVAHIAVANKAAEFRIRLLSQLI